MYAEMNILPSCSHYLRRLIRNSLVSKCSDVYDLFGQAGQAFSDINERLRYLYTYPQDLNNAVLQLEMLVYSHQHAKGTKNHQALQGVTSKILWWLGYGCIQDLDCPSVLVVDDTIEVLQLVTTLLSQSGYRVSQALNSQLAFEHIRGSQPDLIVLDKNLPDIDGLEVYRRLRNSKTTSRIPIIFLSASPIEDVVSEAEHVQCLLKPFKADELLSQVSRSFQLHFPVHPLHPDRLKQELNERRNEAKLLSHIRLEGTEAEEQNTSHFFFRATLDGRYIRVESSMAQICGYQSAEEMVATVSNLWEQVYQTPNSQENWKLCLQYPNQIKNFMVKIKVSTQEVRDVLETICLVQDFYNNQLFYQGYLTFL